MTRHDKLVPAALMIIVLALAVPASANVLILNPGDSIQTSINSAGSGDTIILNPGTYKQYGISIDKSIFIRAASGSTAPEIIINGMQGGSSILTIVSGKTVVLDNLTFFNGTAIHGGAVGNSGTLFVNSSVFHNCSASGSLYASGGAIENYGNLAVASSTFSNCSATFGGAIRNSGGTISSISSSTFSYCSATLTGGAIENGGTISSLHFCRIYHDGSYWVIFNQGSGIDATNNWWGTDNDPSELVSGQVYTSPWLVLKITATPSSFTGSQTSKLRVNLTTNSAGIDTTSGGIFVPDGIPVAFALTSGTGSLSPLAGNTSSGTNTTTFTPSGTGTSTIAGTIDGQTVTIRVFVLPTKIGVFRNSHGWFLDASGNGAWSAAEDTAYGFGMAGDVPVTGDWNHDGKTEIGVFRSGHGWFLDSSGNGAWSAAEDTAYGFGMAGDVPVTGDWNHDGKTEIGVFRSGHGWFLDTSGNGAWGAGDTTYGFGMTGDKPVTGDWNHDGTTEIGVFRNDHGWFLDSSGNGAWSAAEDTAYGFGMTGDMPVTGDWNHDGTTEIGVFRNGHGWFLDASGNGAWSAAEDTAYGFGMTGDVPVTGKWETNEL